MEHWAAAAGIKFAAGLQVHQFAPEQGGRGLLATKALASGSVLVEIPSKWLLDARKARAAFPALSKRAELNDQQLLGFYLAWLSVQLDSPFSEYIQSLPQHYTTTLFWSDQEIALLEDQSVIAQVRQHNQEVARQFAELKHALTELNMADVLPSESKFMWAIASIHSRTIYTGADQVGALCPFADLFNHSAELSTRAVFATGVLRLISDTAIAAGTQAFINYGHSENLVFATHYGFVPETNKLEIVCLPPLDFTPNQEAALNRHGLSYTHSCYASYSGVSWNMLVACLVQCLGDAEIESSDVDQIIETSAPLSRRHAEQALACLEGVIKRKLACYTSIDQHDAALLRSPLNPHQRCALAMRIQSKHILRHTLDILPEQLAFT